MGKYFGTDGVRGVANKELTPELAYNIGRCGGFVLAGSREKPTVLIGKDTRISGDMLEAAMIAGLLSIGANVIRLGVISTPGVAYLTRTMKADAGVMISASHNPVGDNGIKFFGSDGYKLSDDTELEIERFMDADQDDLPRPVAGALGTVTDDFSAKVTYMNYLKTTVSSPLAGLNIVLDCANGAAYELAPRLFREMGAKVTAICAEPNGLNINDQCGSTHPERLKSEVLKHGADLGLSFDGDADRLIAIDEHGEEVDGDYILCICGAALNHAGKLNHSTIVTTVMGNLGFFKAVEEHGMNAVQTAVGDRYVMEAMRRDGYNLGGEQSGHVIFLDYNTTGDGMLTALQLAQTIKQQGRSLSDLKQMMTKFPQVLVNVSVTDKHAWKNNAAIMAAIEEAEGQLGKSGRILVRPSGTESLVRVMAEGPDKETIQTHVNTIVRVIQAELGG